MRFFLDTDSVSFFLRGEGRIVRHLAARGPRQVVVSAITAGELSFGVEKRGSSVLRGKVDRFLDEIPVVPFDFAAAREYGRLLAELESVGTPIGFTDTLLAAHARSVGAILVTHNLRHFERVQDLEITDWY